MLVLVFWIFFVCYSPYSQGIERMFTLSYSSLITDLLNRKDLFIQKYFTQNIYILFSFSFDYALDLLLPLCSVITSGGVWGTIYGVRDQIWISYVQGKGLNP